MQHSSQKVQVHLTTRQFGRVQLLLGKIPVPKPLDQLNTKFTSMFLSMKLVKGFRDSKRTKDKVLKDLSSRGVLLSHKMKMCQNENDSKDCLTSTNESLALQK